MAPDLSAVTKNLAALGNKMAGGRKTRKMRSSKKGTRKISKWTNFVKKIYQEMKKKNKGAKLGDAMKAASKRKSEMK
jgi:hypothetical protein